jgi:hypothetical protein
VDRVLTIDRNYSSKKPQKQRFSTASEAVLIAAEREGFSETSEMLLFRHLIETFQ